MQANNFKLTKQRVGLLPIVQMIMIELHLQSILMSSLQNDRYVDAIEVMIKHVLSDRGALYRVGEWANEFDPSLVCGGNFNDDIFGRALERLYTTDRASLQTKLVLTVLKNFKINTNTIHNDSTSVKVFGAYVNQDQKALQLKRGHSKDHRPDLKQLIYSLSVSDDGALPIHYKTYDGNQTDDQTHKETWQTLRGLLGKSDFLYVGDSKLCTEENLSFIDRNQGRFITIVPRTRAETKTFSEAAYESEIRWKHLLRVRSKRNPNTFETFEVADGLFQLREGFVIHWYRSSEKMKRDSYERDQKIASAMEKLQSLKDQKRRGPKTELTLARQVENILTHYGAKDWIVAKIETELRENFTKATRGKPSKDSVYKRIIKKLPKLSLRINAEGVSRSKAIDGIFPLTTNTQLGSVDVLKHYKYQPKLEKRFSFLKSNLSISPIFLKKNTRIEALMMVYFIALLIGSLIEHQLKHAMIENKIETLPLLPEGRPTKNPTWEQLSRLFEHHDRHALYDDKAWIKTFSEELNCLQQQVLDLIKVPQSAYR